MAIHPRDANPWLEGNGKRAYAAEPNGDYRIDAVWFEWAATPESLQ